MDCRPIGIFDSGLGGINVLNEFIKKLPNENYIYLADTLNFPYGNKTKEQIVSYSKTNTHYLLSQDVKLIIIACGTSTSQALDELRNNYDIPIEGIISPTVEYIRNKNIKKIGVMGTVGTIRSGAWERALKEEIPNIEVINQECPLLADLAENRLEDSEDAKKAIKKYMKSFKEKNIDTIILGCTHYSLFDKIIKKEFDYDVELINTGTIIAEKLNNYLIKNNMVNNEKNHHINIVTTNKNEIFEQNVKKMLKSTKMLDITNIN